MESSSEQQVQQLNEEYRRKLEEIKAQAPESHEPQTEASRITGEHEAFSKTTEDMIRREVPEFETSSHQPGHTVYELPEEKQAQVQQWVSMAAENPYKSVQAAKNSGDIALIDAFHGALTLDENFKELVKRGVLKQMAA